MMTRPECSISWPAGVRWIFLPSCSNSGRPACSSSFFTWVDTAGCVKCSSSAALEKLKCRATASNTFSWRRVAFFISAVASYSYGIGYAFHRILLLLLIGVCPYSLLVERHVHHCSGDRSQRLKDLPKCLSSLF